MTVIFNSSSLPFTSCMQFSGLQYRSAEYSPRLQLAPHGFVFHEYGPSVLSPMFSSGPPSVLAPLSGICLFILTPVCFTPNRLPPAVLLTLVCY